MNAIVKYLLSVRSFLFPCHIVVFFTLTLFARGISAETWIQDTSADIDDLTSETIADWPLDKTRTTIGIAEIVEIRLDLTSWSDTDARLDPTCDPLVEVKTVVDDSLGDVEWEVTGNATPSSSSQAGLYFTAYRSPGNVTITATVKDSHSQYQDEAIVKTKQFTVIAPSGENAMVEGNYPLGTAGPPNNSIGAKTKFNVVLLSSQSVSFENAPETSLPNWPDGTPYVWHAITVSNIHPNWMNMFSDLFGTELFPDSRLDDGVNYQPYSASFGIARSYKNQDDDWVQYTTTTCNLEFQLTGSGRVKFNSTPGSWQGPYQEEVSFE